MRTGYRGSCWKHPTQEVGGVCAPCLREKLVAFASTSEERFAQTFHSHSSSLNSTTSSSSFLSIAHPTDPPNNLDFSRTDQQPATSTATTAAATSAAAAATLRRSVSWSQSKSNAHRLSAVADSLNIHIDANRKRVCTNYRENSAQSVANSLNIHINANGNWGCTDYEDNAAQPSGKHALKAEKAVKSSSWLTSLLNFRIRRGKAPSDSPQKVSKHKGKQQEQFSAKDKIGHACKQAESGIGRIAARGWEDEADELQYTNSANSWMSAPAPPTGRTFGSYLKNNKGYDCQDTRRVIPLSSSSEGGATWRSERAAPGKYELDHKESSWVPWATPLRIFTRKSRKQMADTDFDAGTPITATSANQWKLSSDYELPRPSPTHPTNYSSFYRDSGSLSLYSSPLPGNSRSRGGRRPLDGRSELFHSSPYSSWNFYLTPVRPIKSSLKQRLL